MLQQQTRRGELIPIIPNLSIILETNTNLKRVQTCIRNLYKNPITAKELSQYDGLIANPPRAGALKQFTEIVKSDVKQVYEDMGGNVDFNTITIET